MSALLSVHFSKCWSQEAFDCISLHLDKFWNIFLLKKVTHCSFEGLGECAAFVHILWCM